MSLSRSYKPVYILLLVFCFLMANNAMAQFGLPHSPWDDGGGSTSASCDCNRNIDENSTDDININDGETVCINAADMVYDGTVRLNGGTLCNHGLVMNIVFGDQGGTIYNYGEIRNNDLEINVNNHVRIYNYAGSAFNFNSFGNLELNSHDFALTQFQGATVTFNNGLSLNSGRLVINNGNESNKDPIDPKGGNATFNGGKVFFNNGSFMVLNNYIKGIANFIDISAPTDASKAEYENWGTMNLTGSIVTGGNISNRGIMNLNNFDIPDDSHFNNLYNYAGTDGIVNILNIGTLTLSREITITNNSEMQVSNLYLNTGRLYNHGSLSGANLSLGESSAFDNYGSITLTGNFTNTGAFNLYNASSLSTNNYYNTNTGGSGIAGPDYTGDPEDAASITISGTSENNSNINGVINIADLSLINTAENIGTGFDVAGDRSFIGGNIHFAYLSAGPSTPGNPCSCFTGGLYASWEMPPTDHLCPYGPGTNLHANLTAVPASSCDLAINEPVYTWQPGNMTGASPHISPTVTTQYTVTTTIAGCTFSSVTNVLVTTNPFPVISYTSPPPFFASQSMTLNPVVGGGAVSGWTYSLDYPNSAISINPTTGQIITNGNCFGFYTVKLCPSSPPNSSCGMTCVTATISLVDKSCPFDKPKPLSLCPGDKIQLQVLGNTPTVSWAPAPISPTAGLSCTACATPTLTFDGVATQYTITGYKGGDVCGSAVLTVSVKQDCQKEEIIGCCFSNYGAAVWIGTETTYLNVYCNLVNEVGYTPASTPPLQKGEFQNIKGTVRVLLDWIHNGKNTLYVYTAPAARQGTTSLFGADQKMKGNSITSFNELRLDGSGTKSMFIDEYGYSTLDLTGNELGMQNSVYSMKNPTVTIRRSSGYASNGLSGYFSWAMDAVGTTNPEHVFPLGSRATVTIPFRYRPLVMDNQRSSADEISANFMNIPQAFSDPAFINTPAGPITNQAPNVLQLNHDFYHKIKNTVAPTGTVPSNMSIKAFYLPVDGQYQSLAEWEKDPAQLTRWWGSTPGANASNTPSTSSLTPGMIYAQANGTLNFNHEPFSLARGGFYLNTNSFGNNGPNSGTTFTVSSSPLSPGTSTPTGGGVGTGYGTGANSGNNGNGGGSPTIFSPMPVAGNYTMTVASTNNCILPGQINFSIDNNGNISPSTVLYGTGGTTLGLLSEDVYTIDNINSGITFNATPKDILRKCINTTTVTTSLNNDYVLNLGEVLVVRIPAASAGATIVPGIFKLYNPDVSMSIPVWTSGFSLPTGITPLNVFGPFGPGSYNFAIDITVTVGVATPYTETLKGLIIKTY